jgi:hypothetical protein
MEEVIAVHHKSVQIIPNILGVSQLFVTLQRQIDIR